MVNGFFTCAIPYWPTAKAYGSKIDYKYILNILTLQSCYRARGHMFPLSGSRGRLMKGACGDIILNFFVGLSVLPYAIRRSVKSWA